MENLVPWVHQPHFKPHMVHGDHPATTDIEHFHHLRASLAALLWTVHLTPGGSVIYHQSF